MTNDTRTAAQVSADALRYDLPTVETAVSQGQRELLALVASGRAQYSMTFGDLHDVTDANMLGVSSDVDAWFDRLIDSDLDLDQSRSTVEWSLWNDWNDLRMEALVAFWDALRLGDNTVR